MRVRVWKLEALRRGSLEAQLAWGKSKSHAVSTSWVCALCILCHFPFLKALAVLNHPSVGSVCMWPESQGEEMGFLEANWWRYLERFLFIWFWSIYSISSFRSVFLVHRYSRPPKLTLGYKHWAPGLNLKSLKHTFAILSSISPIVISFLPSSQWTLLQKYFYNLCFLHTCITSIYCWKCGCDQGWT